MRLLVGLILTALNGPVGTESRGVAVFTHRDSASLNKPTFFATSHGLHDLRKKRYEIFEGMWAWGPHGYATPLSLGLKVAEY